jgi:uncharacterized protein YecT (DUF1311 family)
MERIIGLAILACAMALHCGGVSAANARKAWSPVQPVRPGLVENQEPELCAIVLNTAEQWFGSTSIDPPDLLGSGLDVRIAESMAPRPNAPLGFSRLDVDLDDDHRTEVLLITNGYFRDETYHESFILRSAGDIDGLFKAIVDAGTSRSSRVYPAGVIDYGPRENPAAGVWTTNVQVLFEWRRQYYLASALTEDSSQAGLALRRLNADGTLTTTCRVATDDPNAAAENMKQAREIRSFLKARSTIGTSGRTYCGTSNFSWRVDRLANDTVIAAATRPWTLADGAAATEHDGEYSALLWQFLESWSLIDAWSRREYLVFLETLEPARRAYARYLQSQFGLDATSARTRAASVIDGLVASRFVVPAAFADGGQVDWQVARDYFARARNDPGYSNRFGKTSLMMAAHMNRIDLVRDLLAKGADPNAMTRKALECGFSVTREFRTALMYAAENASPLVMKALVDAGAKTHVADSEQNHIEDYLGWNPRLTDEEKRWRLADLTSGATHVADAPGFDCGRARTRVEKAICSSEVLRLLDAELTVAYARALLADPGLKTEQRRWTARRAETCADKAGLALHECLAEFTAGRERYLQYLVEP